MNSIIDKIRQDLKENSDEKTRQSSKRFFKNEVAAYGVSSSVVRRISSENFQLLTDKSKERVFDVCEELWKSGLLEESFVACFWSLKMKKQYAPCDFIVFEDWIDKYISNWASCDTFCNQNVGDFLQIYPEFLSSLNNWAVSENMWLRRAAAVSLIVPVRKGIFTDKAFEIADILLTDNEDLVQKAYGWLLKVASAKNCDGVFDYVMKNKDIMPRTALRYAIEKMPAALRKAAMEK